MFEIQGGAYFLTDFKWLAHKIWMLESTSKLVGRKICYIHVLLLFKISRNLLKSKLCKHLVNLYFTK